MMADDAPQVEKRARSMLRKWGLIAAIIGVFSGGSAAATAHFFASWVEMNSRPGDIVTAADIAPELMPLIHDNQDDITDIRDLICEHHPAQLCEEN